MELSGRSQSGWVARIRPMAGIAVRLSAALLVVGTWDLRSIDNILSILCLPVLLLASDLFCGVIFVLYLLPALTSWHSAAASVALTAGLALPFWWRSCLLAGGAVTRRFTGRYAPAIRTVLTVSIPCVALLSLHRDATWWTPLAYAFLFFLLRQSLPVSPGWPVREWIPNLALVSLSLAVSAGVGETMARFMPAGRAWERAEFYEHHPQAGFMPKPNAFAPHFRNACKGEWVEVETRISSQGLRDREYGPRAPDEYRVFVLGDSFTMGWGLEVEDGYVKKLERLLEEANLPVTVSVLNGGSGSYGPWQELYLLRDRGVPLQPCLVLHQLFPSNDIENTLAKVGRFLQAFNRGAQQDLIRWQNRGAWPVRLEEWLKDHLAIYRATLRACDSRDMLAPWLWKMRFSPPEPQIRVPQIADRPFNLEVCLRDWYPELEEGWAMFESDILAIKHECESRGIAYAAFCLPDMCDVGEKQWRRATRKLGPDAYERYKDVRLTEEFFERERIVYPPVRSLFENAENRDGLYLPCDGHLSKDGTSLVAEELKRFLIQYFLPPGGVPECTN